MRKPKALAALTAVLMSLSFFASCAKTPVELGTEEVGDSDPWYGSVRIVPDKDLGPSEMLMGTCAAASDDKVFYMYSAYDMVDYDNCRRTVLNTYDNGGELMSSTEVTGGDPYVINAVMAMRAGSDGKTAEVIADTWGNQGFQTSLIKIDLDTAEITDIVEFTDGNGNSLEKDGVGVSEVEFVGDYCVAMIWAFTGPAFYLFSGTDYVAELDLSTVDGVIWSYEPFSFDKEEGTVCVIAHRTGDTDVLLQFDSNDGHLVSCEDYVFSDDQDIKIADFEVTESGDLCRIDSLGNITKLITKDMTEETVIDNNWYSPYFSDLSGDNRILSCTDAKAVLYSRLTGPDAISPQSTDSDVITILTKADSNPHAGKRVIELAMPLDTGVSAYLSNAIYEFNRTDDEYLIRVWNKYKTGFKVGRNFGNIDMDEEKIYTMIQELKGEEAPDLAIGIQRNYAMRDDIFMDLTGFLSDSVMDKQYGNIIDASRIGDKLYFLPVTLEIEGLVTNRDLLEDGAVGITFEDYDAMVRGGLDGFSPYDYPDSEYYNKSSFVLSCIDTKAAIEGDSVDFGDDQFYAAIEYAKDNFQYDDPDSTPLNFISDFNSRFRGESIYARCSGYLDFICACYSNDNDYSLIGTPSVDARGPRFRALETISVASSTNKEEGCRKFLNFLFDGAGYDTEDPLLSSIITNREIMESVIPSITAAHNELLQGKIDSDNAMVETDFYHDKIATESMQQSFLDCLATISTYYYEDPRIVSFVAEETAAYYAGDVTAEEVVEFLNDRVDKYIHEM